MTSCQQLPMVQSPSSNFNSRVNHLIIHFTSENFGESLRILTGSVDRPVSAHYSPEPGDPTYDQSSLVIYELVPTEFRAWHAGVSYWAGKTGLNDQSIGIEIVNESRCLESIKALANSPALRIAACSNRFRMSKLTTDPPAPINLREISGYSATHGRRPF